MQEWSYVAGGLTPYMLVTHVVDPTVKEKTSFDEYRQLVGEQVSSLISCIYVQKWPWPCSNNHHQHHHQHHH